MGDVRNTYFADINVNGTALDIARATYGLQIIRAVDLGMDRIPDPALMVYAAEHGYVMVTGNSKHFPPIAQEWAAQGKTHFGLIIISGAVYKNAAYIAEWLALYEEEDLTNRTEWIKGGF